MKKAKDKAAIDTVPLPERVLEGQISQVGEKYLLTVAGQQIDVPAGITVSESQIRKYVGKKVAVAMPRRGSGVLAIGTWPTPERPRFTCVLCYVPAPDVFRRIDPVVRESMIREMVRQNIMSPQLGSELAGKRILAARR